MHLEQKLDTYIHEQMQRKLIPGLSMAVIKDGATMLEKSYGLASVEHNTPATTDTVYEIFAITQSFTATAILLLVAAGKLSLDESLARFRPGLPATWQAVKVRHLLTHTSGIPPWTIDWERADLTMEEIDQGAFGRPLHFEPGAEYEEVQTNYNLLGMIIHQLTGAPYDTFLHKRIFQPLGMNATCHNDVHAIVPNRADGYHRGKGGLYRRARIQWSNINRSPNLPANGANGSLLSSLRDLIKWDAALTRGQILSHTQQAELWSPLILKNRAISRWIVQDFYNHKLISYDGGYAGFTSCMARFVDDRLTVIILTNQDSKPWDMCKDVARLVEPGLAEAF